MEAIIFIGIIFIMAGTILLKFGVNLRDCPKHLALDLEEITKYFSLIFGVILISAGYNCVNSINIFIITIFLTLLAYWHIRNRLKPKFFKET